eukprot:6997936-Prymnesium_polylepis.1
MSQLLAVTVVANVARAHVAGACYAVGASGAEPQLRLAGGLGSGGAIDDLAARPPHNRLSVCLD